MKREGLVTLLKMVALTASPSRVFAAFAIALTTAASFCFGTGAADMVADSPFRVVTGGIAVMLLPGILFGHIVGVRAGTFFEAVSKGFAFSLLIAALPAFVAILAHATIREWAIFILFFDFAAALVVLVSRDRRRNPSRLIDALATDLAGKGNWNSRLLVGVVILLSWCLYRWADDLTAVDWEVALHMVYIRQFASGLPLGLAESNLRPDIIPPNLFFLLWEFLLAGISTVAGVDPLIGALRSRWLIPFLGLSAYFFFLRQVLHTARMAYAGMWITLVMILSWFNMIAPAPLTLYGISTGFQRPVFGFLGSIHHSDAAMEVLLPLIAGYLFLFLRRGRGGDLAVFCSLLAVSFLFHVREYFQVMWYAVVAAGAYAIYRRPQWHLFARRFGALAAAFVVIAAALFLLSKLITPNLDQMIEFGNKSAFLDRILNQDRFIYVERLFNFLMHGTHWAAPSPPNVYSWLILLGLLLPVVVIASPRPRLLFSGYVMLLWWTTMCFSVTQYVLILLTYNEIVLAKVRFLPIFAYALIAVGWVAYVRLVLAFIERRHSGREARLALAMAIVFLAQGLLFAGLWRIEAPAFRFLPYGLEAVALASWAAVFLVLRQPAMADRIGLTGWRRRFASARMPSTKMAVACLVLFVLPVTAKDAYSFMTYLASHQVDAASLFDGNGPTGLGKATIGFLRKDILPRSRILVDPLSSHMVGAYAPHYVVPIVKGQFAADGHHISAAREDRHPMFNSRLQAGGADAARIDDYLADLRADYVLAPAKYRAGIEALRQALPGRLKIIFEDAATHDVILAVTRPSDGKTKAAR